MQGIPFAFVNSVSPIFYKKLGWTNADITFLSSLLLLPWTIKFLIAPILEVLFTKRNAILKAQGAFIILILLFPLVLNLNHFPQWSALIFFLIGITASIHDMVSDGLYIDYLSVKHQAKYVGLTSIAYHSGVLICKTGFIYLLGYLLEKSIPMPLAWFAPSLVLAMLVMILWCLNFYYLPAINASNPVAKIHFNRFHDQMIAKAYQTIWKTIQTMPNVMGFILFALLYHFPELQMMKIMPLYLLDHMDQGGLQFNLQQTGFIYGGLGTLSSLMGMSFSGWMLHRFGLKKMLLPITLFTALGNGFFILGLLLLSHTMLNVSVCAAGIYFFFGFSNSVYILYLMSTVKQHAGMSLYAFATSLALLGTLISGALSGKIQMMLKYPGFFIWVFLLSVGVVVLVKCTWMSTKLQAE